MIDAYASGDVYWGFSRKAGLVDCDRDKQNPAHEALRNQIKVLFLAIGYGMGIRTLARQLECPEHEARDLMRRFEVTFPTFCEWSQQVGWCAGWHGQIRNLLGWPLLVDDDTRPTTIRNFPDAIDRQRHASKSRSSGRRSASWRPSPWFTTP